jgi:hypothetical protein
VREANPLINPDEADRLEVFASEVTPGNAIVEIGSWAGTSAERLSRGAPSGVHITCVDVWVDWIDPPAEQYPVRGDDAFEIFCSRVDRAKVTALRARSLVVSGGVLAVHDYAAIFDPVCWWTEGPTKAVDEVMMPSGLWSPLGVVGSTWAARRV